jgi:pyrimidine operon attenuation protein/uracil phosphoribosyltransferase
VPDKTVVLDRDDMRRTLVRIAHEIVEKNPPGEAVAREAIGPRDAVTGSPGPVAGPADQSATQPGHLAIVGIQRRGAVLARRLHALTSELIDAPVPLGLVDISFYRDDLRLPGKVSATPVVHATQLDFPVEGRTIVIVDDVLYTGRTVRAAIDEIFDYGRPARVQLAVLVDRGHRELPIRPDYVGKNLPTAQDQRVNVRVEEIDGYEEVTIGPAAEPRRQAA